MFTNVFYSSSSSSSSSIYCIQAIQLQIKTIGYRIIDNAPAMEQVDLNYLNYTPNLM
jgi:hypothetical protein